MISPGDMASFEVLHTQNHSSDLYSSEEFSFLPDAASSSIPNGDINHHVNDNFDLTNMQSALGTTMPSTAEVHAQLLDILGENKSLKEKLNKNNAMMKEQMATISDWREHMIVARDQQQQKISALEAENAKLLETLNKASNVTNQKNKSCEKCTIFETSLNNMLAIDSFEETESIFLGMSYFRENLYTNLKTLCGLMETLGNSTSDIEDRSMIKTFVVLLKFKIAVLEGGNAQASVTTDEETGYEVVQKKPFENVLQLRVDMEDLKKMCDAKQAELNKMTTEKEELYEKIICLESKMREHEMTLVSKCEEVNNKLDIEDSLSEKYKERCVSLQQQLEEYQLRLDRAKISDDHVVKELQEDIRNLQDILKLEQQANQSAKDKLAQVMLKCEKLQVDYDRVTRLLELEAEKVNQLTVLKENEAKDFLSKIDELTAQFFEMEEQKRDCEGKIRNLEAKLSDVEEQSVDIPIFKEQIEQYEKDYQSIKEAHEKAAVEAEQLKNELKKYEKKDDSCPCACGSSSRRHKSCRSSDNKDQSLDAFECPFCAEKFRRESEVNHHIMRNHNEDFQYAMMQ